MSRVGPALTSCGVALGGLGLVLLRVDGHRRSRTWTLVIEVTVCSASPAAGYVGCQREVRSYGMYSWSALTWLTGVGLPHQTGEVSV